MQDDKIGKSNEILSLDSRLPEETNSTETKPTELDKSLSTSNTPSISVPVTPANIPKSMSQMLLQKAFVAKTPEDTQAYLEMEQKYRNTRYKTTLSICCFLAGLALQVLQVSNVLPGTDTTIGYFLMGAGLAGLGIDYISISKKGDKVQ